MDEGQKEDLMEEINEEYDEIREEHYDSLKVYISVQMCTFDWPLKYATQNYCVVLQEK